jgi:hypothetical protein
VVAGGAQLALVAVLDAVLVHEGYRQTSTFRLNQLPSFVPARKVWIMPSRT